VTQGRQGVLQGPATTHVHVHVTTGHAGNTTAVAQGHQFIPASAIVPLGQQFHRDPQSTGKMPLQPGQRLMIRIPRGQPENQAPGKTVLDHIRARQIIRPFVGGPSPCGNQGAQPGPGSPVRHQGHKAQAIGQLELAAVDKGQTVPNGRLMSPDRPGHRALVGDSQCVIPKFGRTRHQLPGVGRAPQETEITQAMKLGVRHGGTAVTVYSYSTACP
jgi:hypothetical protein